MPWVIARAFESIESKGVHPFLQHGVGDTYVRLGEPAAQTQGESLNFGILRLPEKKYEI